MTETISDRVRTLIDIAHDTLSSRASTHDPIGQEAQRVLSRFGKLPHLVSDFSQSDHPIVEVAGIVLAQRRAVAGALLSQLEPVIEYLPWKYSYPERADAPGLGRRIAFAELIGPEAPFVSRDLCLGFTLIAPHTYYPPHHHPATELYYVVTGTAAWNLDGADSNHPPGTFVLHRSQARHAMRTGNEALLALYTWSGPDMHTTSAYSGN